MALWSTSQTALETCFLNRYSTRFHSYLLQQRLPERLAPSSQWGPQTMHRRICLKEMIGIVSLCQNKPNPNRVPEVDWFFTSSQKVIIIMNELLFTGSEKISKRLYGVWGCPKISFKTIFGIQNVFIFIHWPIEHILDYVTSACSSSLVILQYQAS